MARNSDGTSGNGLQVAAGSLLSGGGPWCIAFWFKSNDVSQTNRYISSFDTGTPQKAIIYGFVNSGGNAQIEFFSSTGHTGTNPRTGSQITITDTNWHHIAYRKAGTGTAEYARFLDGTKTVINASATTVFGLTSNITTLFNSTTLTTSAVNAHMAEFAVWDHISGGGAVPNDAQIAALAKGASPLFFPRGLVSGGVSVGTTLAAYWPMRTGGAAEVSRLSRTGVFSLANTGTVQSAHPRMIYPTSPRVGFTAAPSSGFNPAWARNSNIILGAGAP